MPRAQNWGIHFDGEWRAMCCPGCASVAEAIIDNGLADFYQKRTAFSESATLVPEQLSHYDSPAADGMGGETNEVSLIIEGISCSACIWLLERHVRQLNGVASFKINYATRRAQLEFCLDSILLSEVLTAIRAIGYRALPYDANKQFLVLQAERKDFISRIGVALLFSMQVMMITLGVYMAGIDTIETQMLSFLRWISAFLSLPVIVYSAKPFLVAAYRDIKNAMPGMDVPVVLGISLGFIASVWNTWLLVGDTYYESVCMFILFLLLARYVEFLTRWYAVSSSERLTQAIPVVAKKRLSDGSLESVAAKTLQLGDEIQINPGDVIPADSLIVSGSSQVDESILTGENEAINKSVGDTVLGGSHNLQHSLVAKVSCLGKDSTLSTISRLIDRAHSEKPSWVELADRYASAFVSMVVLLTVGTAWYGFSQGAEDWFSTALSVLVVTCPCALSLATPTAYTAAMSALFNKGIIITKGQALDKLASIKHVIFDKTGTLTQGVMRITDYQQLAQLEYQECLDIAISLEAFSEHPIARAFMREQQGKVYPPQQVKHVNGAGLMANINQQEYYLGSWGYVAGVLALEEEPVQMSGSLVYLATAEQLLAVFEIEDDIRQGAVSTVTWLQQQGKVLHLVSGDRAMPVDWLAAKLGIERVKSNASPVDKLNEIECLQQRGDPAVMIGDGVNDAPIMAKADVSISVSGASQLARSSSDILLMGDDMSALRDVFALSSQTRRVIKQNMCWALVYNIGALPLAMAGQVEPWQAALGMSVSSLVVVLNSFRLRMLRPAGQEND